MNTLLRVYLRFSLALAGLAFGSSVFAQAPEIPNPNLQDIAMVTWHTGPIPQLGIPMYSGPVIIYNPNVITQVGPVLTAFFRAHEYCHITLNHIQQLYFVSNPYNRSWMSQTHEFQADACATEHLLSQGNVASVRMAAQWFFGRGPLPLVPSHPPGQARASNIVNVARNLGVNL